jgi:hypothetical protein
MFFISKDEFLKLFHKQKSGTFAEFLKNAKVKRGKTLVPLVDYMKSNNVSTKNIKELFHYIVNRAEYLERFYDVSMKLPDELTISHVPMKNKNMDNNSLVVYKNVIRNMFYKDILRNTKSGFENTPSFLIVLEDLFIREIIDYKLLTPSALHYMNLGRLGSVFASFYFRASIMNPYLVYSLNQSVLKGRSIFTPTMGWGSYCYGFLECPGVYEYVGTDVIPNVCNKTKQFATQFYPNKLVDIYQEPSEQLAKNQVFKNKYKNHFDVVFFSPPYYRLELYPGKEQSTTQYKTYEEWLDKYWEATIKLCYFVLKPGGKMCYILSGYGSENTGNVYDLLKDMNKVSAKYFILKSSQPMYNKNVNSTNHRETNEKIMVYVK